jgi:2'-5' RNA ligase
VRLFLGLPVPDALIPPLLSVQQAVPLGRAVGEDDLHLTLVFLGDVDSGTAVDLHEDLDGRRLPRPLLAFDGMATYGGDRAKLLAMDIRPDPALAELHAICARAARGAGIALERRRFRPHVTLLRFGSGLPPRRQPELDRALKHLGQPQGAAEAQRLVLFRSHPGETGATYGDLAAYPLV